MQIIDLKLQQINLYCPVTGAPITIENEGMFEDAPSLIAYWHHEILDEPVINDSEFKKAWNTFYASCDEDNGTEFDYDTFENFLIQFPQPNWVVFKCSTIEGDHGPILDTMWYILNLDIEVND
jgi:hypothetical protein